MSSEGRALQHTHQSHASIIKRLKRAEGHLHKTILMIEEGRACIDVAQQLHAVHNAIGNAKRLYVQDHIEGCLSGDEDAPDDLSQRMREFKEISRYL